MADKIAIVVPDIPARDNVETRDTARASAQSRASNVGVRRPLDVITVADDTYATISLLSGDPLLNTSVGSGESATNANLLVQSLSFSISEKHQRAQTFDVDRLFFFGQNLPSLRIEAVTLDSLTFQWLQELYENYTTRISGSITAENLTKVQITSDERIYTGYILDMSFTKNAQIRAQANVSISMSLTNLTHLRALQSTFFGSTNSSDVPGVLMSVSESLMSVEPSQADPNMSLMSQVSSEEAVNIPTSGASPLSDIYVNEYPYGGDVEGSKGVAKREPAPVVEGISTKVEVITERPDVMREINELINGKFPGIVAVPDGTPVGVLAADVDVPSVIPLPTALVPQVAASRAPVMSLETLIENPAEFNEALNAAIAGLERVR